MRRYVSLGIYKNKSKTLYASPRREHHVACCVNTAARVEWDDYVLQHVSDDDDECDNGQKWMIMWRLDRRKKYVWDLARQKKLWDNNVIMKWGMTVMILALQPNFCPSCVMWCQISFVCASKCDQMMHKRTIRTNDTLLWWVYIVRTYQPTDVYRVCT